MMAQEHYNGPIIEEIHESPTRRHPLRELHGQNSSMNNIPTLKSVRDSLRTPGAMQDSDFLYQRIDDIRRRLEYEQYLYDRGEVTPERRNDIEILKVLHEKCKNRVDVLVSRVRERVEREEYETLRRQNSQDIDEITYVDQSSRFRSHHQHPPTRQREESYSSNEEDSDDNAPTFSRNQSNSRMHDDSIQRREQRPRMKLGKNRVSKNRFKKIKPGQKALREIRQLQASTNLLVQKAPLRRLIVETLNNETRDGDFRIRREAVEALHEASESFLVQTFENSSLLSAHAKRVTLMVNDMKLYRRLCLKW